MTKKVKKLLCVMLAAAMVFSGIAPGHAYASDPTEAAQETTGTAENTPAEESKPDETTAVMETTGEPVPESQPAETTTGLEGEPETSSASDSGNGNLEKYKALFGQIGTDLWDFYWVFFYNDLAFELTSEELTELETYVKNGAATWNVDTYFEWAAQPYTPLDPEIIPENAGIMPMANGDEEGSYTATSGMSTLGHNVNLATLGRNGKDVWELTLDGEVAFCLDMDLMAHSGAGYTRTGTSNSSIVRRAIAYYTMTNTTTEGYEFAQMYIWCNGNESTYTRTLLEYCISRNDSSYTPEKLLALNELQLSALSATFDSGLAYRAGQAYIAITNQDTSQLDAVYVFTGPAGYQRFATLYQGTWTPNTPPPVEPGTGIQYADATASANRTASRQHTVQINNKYAEVTGESLEGAVFEVFEDGNSKGTITTDADGRGSLSWTVSGSGSATVTKQYCSNYDELDPADQALVTGYTSYDEAYAAALAEAEAQAQAQADAAANASHNVTVKEITVPHGFNATGDAEQSTSLSGNATANISVANQPWKAKLTIDKVDALTGSRLTEDAAFVLYEWNGSAYEVSQNYDIIRLDDGTYTVKGRYADSEQGYLYYTQKNEGHFGLGEAKAPDGYLTDTDIWYFQITADGQEFKGHNAHPENFDTNNADVFANQPAHVQIRIPKVDRYSGEWIVEDAVFTVHVDGEGGFSRPVTFTKQADGSYLSSEIYYADTFDNANYGLFYVVETKAPDGYYGDWADEDGNKVAGSDENKVQYKFVVEGDLSNHDTVIDITNDVDGEVFWNEQQYGSVILYKYDDEAEGNYEDGDRITQGDTTMLDGAVYGLYAAEDIYHPDGNTGLLYEADELVATATVGQSPVYDAFGYLLDEDGNRCIESGKEPATTATPGQTGFAQVVLGKYYVSEIVPADGYLPDTTDHRGDELTKYYVTFTYKGETEPVIVRDERAQDDDNNLTMDDELDTPDIYSGDFVQKQAAQFVKLEDLNSDTEKLPIEGAGFSIYRLDSLSGVVDGTIQPDGEVWTTGDMDKFIDYDFSEEQTALLYKRDSEAWTDADTAWLVPTGVRPNEYVVGEMFSDEDGYICTPELPYGQYILVETTVPEDKKMADPILVTINHDSADAQPIRYIGNETTMTYLRIVKTDADAVDGDYDTVLRPGAAYRLRLTSDPAVFDTEVWSVDADGYLTYYSPALDVVYGTAENPFVTKCIYEDGKIVDCYIELDQLLPVGEYELVEVDVPDGYVLNGAEQTVVDTSTDTANSFEITDTPRARVQFEISNDTVYPDGQMGEHKHETEDQYGRLVQIVEQENQEQKGIVEITKYGEQLYSAEASGPSLEDKLPAEPWRDIMAEDEYTVPDQVFTYELAPVEGAVFDIYAAEDIYTQQIDPELLELYGDDPSHFLAYAKDDLVGTVTTDEMGYGYLADLYVGKYYIKERVAGDGFVLNPFVDKFEITADPDNTVNFILTDSYYENDRQKVEISATKRDADTNEPVAGAIYGLYNTADITSYITYDADTDSYIPYKAGNLLLPADTLVATAVTGEDGVAKFEADLPLGEYYILELEAPEGYTSMQPADSLPVDATYDGTFGGQDVATQVHSEETKNLLYVNQKTKHVFTKSDFTSAALLDGALLEIREIQVDENGQPVRDDNGEYVTTLVESWISDKEEVHYFYTDDRGFFIEIDSPDDLPDGKDLETKYGHLIEGLKEGREYLFLEITAPDGYVGYGWSDEEVREANQDENLITESVRFTVEDGNVVAEHEMKDQRVIGNLVITKEGEVLVNAEVNVWDSIKGFFNTVFSYVMGRISNASFDVYVREDIYWPDQTGTLATYDNGDEVVTLAKDTLVATITTGLDGLAMLEGLPLGTYYIVETGAGDGTFVLNDTVAEINLAYQGQTVPVVVHDTTTYTNARQKVQITVTKKSHYESEYAVLNTGEVYDENGEDLTVAGAVFALYTRDAIYGYEVAANGVITENPDALIEAGTMIERVETGADGSVTFVSDLPNGTYILREEEAPEGYLASTKEYVFEAAYTGQDGPEVIELSYDFYNEPTIVGFDKTDLDGVALPGAALQVTAPDGTVMDTWTTDGTTHYVRHLALDTEYTLSEVQPAPGYVTAEPIIFKLVQQVGVTYNMPDPGDETGKEPVALAQVATVMVLGVGETGAETWTEMPSGIITMQDDITKVYISKVDMANGKELPGATLVVKDSEGNEVDRWVSTDTPHYIEKLPVGSYTLTEITAPSGYQLAETITFEVLDTGEIQTVTMYDEKTPQTPPPSTPETPPDDTPGDGGGETGDNYLVLLGLLLAVGAMAGLAVTGGIVVAKGKKDEENE